MTDLVRTLAARAFACGALLGAAGVSAAPSRPGDTSTSPWGCCAGCANGGPLGPDGSPLVSPASPASAPSPVAAPAVSASAAVAKGPVAPPAGPDGVTAVDFALLAGYDYAPSTADAPPQSGVPETIRALDGRRVRVTGFLLPLELMDGRCRQFLILRNQAACCYGRSPLPTEWILGSSKQGVRAEQDAPLTFAGTLRVGAKFEDGVFTGVYSLEVQDEPTR